MQSRGLTFKKQNDRRSARTSHQAPATALSIWYISHMLVLLGLLADDRLVLLPTKQANKESYRPLAPASFIFI
jgi:hypothetical protein